MACSSTAKKTGGIVSSDSWLLIFMHTVTYEFTGNKHKQKCDHRISCPTE